MMQSMRPAYRRTLALFLLAGALFATWSMVIGPLLTGFMDRQSEIGETRYLLGKYEKLAARRDAAERNLLTAESLQQARGEFLREATPALASANLQSRLRAIVSANGVVMSAARSLPVRDRDGFSAVALRVTLVGDLNAIRRTLHKIESNVPYLIVDNLDLKPSRVQGSDELISMDAIFDVIGFLPDAEKTQ